MSSKGPVLVGAMQPAPDSGQPTAGGGWRRFLDYSCQCDLARRLALDCGISSSARRPSSQRTPHELTRMRTPVLVPKAIILPPIVSSKVLRGDQMAHQAHKGLQKPGDFRPESWRDVVGLLMALVGLALVVGMMLTM